MVLFSQLLLFSSLPKNTAEISNQEKKQKLLLDTTLKVTIFLYFEELC